MSEETTTETQETTTTATNYVQTEPAALPDDRPAQNRIAELERKLAAADKMTAEREEADRLANESKALENQEFEKVIASKEEALSKLQADFETQKSDMEKTAFDSKLIQAGITNEFTRDGIAAKYMALDADAKAGYLDKLKTDNPDLFKEPVHSIGSSPAGSVSQGAGGGDDWTKIKQQSQPEGNSPTTVREAWKKINAYQTTHGKLPPGF